MHRTERKRIETSPRTSSELKPELSSRHVLPDARQHPFRPLHDLPRSSFPFLFLRKQDVSSIIRLTVRGSDRLSFALLFFPVPPRPFSLSLLPAPRNSQIPLSNFSRARRFLSVSTGHYSRDVARTAVINASLRRIHVLAGSIRM